jgi:16S rRNA pseudouridine516 synthase
LDPPSGTVAFAKVTLLDGAYHEVKRIFAALDSHVLRLARVSHAGIDLPRELGAGEWVELDSL